MNRNGLSAASITAENKLEKVSCNLQKGGKVDDISKEKKIEPIVYKIGCKKKHIIGEENGIKDLARNSVVCRGQQKPYVLGFG